MTSDRNGKIGEHLAEKFLISRGYDILERNYRTKFGEIDLIAKYKDCTVFVEVKLRSNSNYGFPVEYVNKKKQEKIIKTCQVYLDVEKDFIRFDIISIIKEGSKYHIEHIKNAF